MLAMAETRTTTARSNNRTAGLRESATTAYGIATYCTLHKRDTRASHCAGTRKQDNCDLHRVIGTAHTNVMHAQTLSQHVTD
jgi:hypothetical protein